MELIKYFFAGVFLANGIPHLVKGITGQKHMTPFKRVSSPVLNVVWAFINFVISILLFGWFATEEAISPGGTNLIITLIGAFAVATYLASFWSNPDARLPWHK